MYVCKKPLEITLRTAEGRNLYAHGIIPPRPHSPPTTDTTGEITKQESFDKRHTSLHTPDPYLYNLRDTYKGNEENLDPMSAAQDYNRFTKSEQKKITHHRTQTEIKATRNVGTMCELSKTNIVNNGILSQQYQIHRTQKPQQQTVHDSMTNGHYNQQQSTSSSHQRQPSHSLQHDDKSIFGQQQTTKDNYLDPTPYSHTSTLHEMKQSPRKTKPKPQTNSIETDTSFDGMKHPVHKGVQPDPRPTKDKATATYTEELPPPQIIYPTTTSTKQTHSHHQTTHSTLIQDQDNYIEIPSVSPKQKHDQHQTPTKGYITNYEEKTPKDSSTINYNQHKKIPYKPLPNKEEPPLYILRQDNYIQELPGSSSTLIPTYIVRHSVTSSRSSDQYHKSPPRQQPLNYAKQQRTPSVIQSPPLNIATESPIPNPPTYEVAIPFEKEITYERNRSFTLNNDDNSNPKNNTLFLMPVINSSRTYVVERQTPPDNTIRKSRINKNFYLATSPTLRPLRKTYQSVDSGLDQSAQIHDPYDITGQHYGSQDA